MNDLVYFCRSGLKKIIFFTCVLFLPWLSWGAEVRSADFKTILESKAEALTIWNYDAKSKIFVFDFVGLSSQGRTFNRATQLSEQVQQYVGYPRVLTNDEFAEYMGAIRRTQANFAFGHDLLVSELVQFFNLADRDKIELFPEEVFLREFLLSQGLIRQWRGFYQSLQPGVVILSIPQQQARKDNEPPVSSLARLAIFSHEIAHAEYYTNQYYAAYCKRFWNESLNDAQREAFISLFKKYNYDVSNGDLIVNEMQAYLMFTPDPNSFSASKLGVKDAELDAMRAMFRSGKPPTNLL